MAFLEITQMIQSTQEVLKRTLTSTGVMDRSSDEGLDRPTTPPSSHVATG
jgi:hypothetical protein